MTQKMHVSRNMMATRLSVRLGGCGGDGEDARVGEQVGGSEEERKFEVWRGSPARKRMRYG